MGENFVVASVSSLFCPILQPSALRRWPMLRRESGSRSWAYQRSKFVDQVSEIKKTMYPKLARHEMISFVPTTARRILDVGCNAGTFGRALKEQRGVEVWGVEPNAKAAALAGKVLDRVIVGPFSADAELPNGYFDAVVFNDVLEHLVDPDQALSLSIPKLGEDGVVIASLPNLLEFKNLRHMLVERDFRYEELGIRDRTHLRFFTKKSILRLFEEAGFEVLKIEGINENWWSPSIIRRLAFRLFGNSYLMETKFVQYGVVARPSHLRHRSSFGSNGQPADE